MDAATDRFEDLADRIDAFARARGWQESHDAKSLLQALVGEVGEVAEVLQWLSPTDLAALSDPASVHRQPLQEELADVPIYLVELAGHVDVDLIEAAHQKLAKNAIKHPIR